MISIGATVEFPALQELLGKMQMAGANLKPWFAGALDPDMTRRLIRQFDTWGGEFDTPWPALKPSTVRARSRVGKRGGGLAQIGKSGRARAGIFTPMRDTLRLWAAYTKAGGPGSLRIINDHSYERGVRGGEVPYAVFHQHPKGNRPARPVLPNDASQIPVPILNVWEASLLHYIQTGTVTPVP